MKKDLINKILILGLTAWLAGCMTIGLANSESILLIAKAEIVYTFDGEFPGYDEEPDGLDLPETLPRMPQTVNRPLNGRGVQPAGSGTETDPYLIATLDNLAWIAEDFTRFDKYYLQTAVIDASPTNSWNAGEGWFPIGYYISATEDYPFTGHYDGQNFSISGLYINRPGSDDIGFFGYTAGAILDDMVIDNCYFTGNNFVGGLGGFVHGNSVITGCSVSGQVSGNNYIGMLAGYAQAGSTATDCMTAGAVSGGNHVGGMVGRMTAGSMNNCISGTQISATADYSGGLIGSTGNMMITGCSASGTVASDGLSVGGLIGYLISGNLSQSSSTGPVTGLQFVGGLAGTVYNFANLLNCHATGTVTAVQYHAGGFAGRNSMYSNIQDCHATGEVFSDGTSGGFVGSNGWATTDNSQIVNSWCSGSVSGTHGLGGFAGQNINGALIQKSFSLSDVTGIGTLGGFVASNYNNATVDRCYARGNINGSGEYIGGMVGYNFDNGMINMSYATGWVTAGPGAIYTGGFTGASSAYTAGCYWDVETTGMSTSPEAFGKTTLELSLTSTYQDVWWDFITDWVMNPLVNDGYPTLGWQGNPSYAEAPGGSGSPADPWQIQNLNNLYWISQYTANYYAKHLVQTAYIDASSTALWNGGRGFPCLGYFYDWGHPDNREFSGTYDGQGNVIADLYINRPALNATGLFGFITGSGSLISNLTLTDANVTGYKWVGALAGVIKDWASIHNCHVTGQVQGDNRVGGLCGLSNTVGLPYGLISNCSAECTVLASTQIAGGLVGLCSQNTQITNSYALGQISVMEYAGALAGHCYGALIEDCYAGGTVSVVINSAGGLSGSIINTTIQNSYATASVAGNLPSGGLVGFDFGGSTVTNSFWDTQTSGQAASDGGIGLTTAEMKQIQTFLTAGWDFLCESTNGNSDYWGIHPAANNGYPFLSWTGDWISENCPVWTGLQNTDWDNAMNWNTQEVPAPGYSVTIALQPNLPVLGSFASLLHLSVDPGAGLTLAPNAGLQVGGKLETGNNLVMEDGAYIITQGAINGSAYVKRNLNGTMQYHYLSTPVSDPLIANVFPMAHHGNIWLRTYDEPAGNWLNLSINDDMETGKGYAFYTDLPGSQAVFTGFLNKSSNLYYLSNQGNNHPDYDGWNLLGNPFPAPIDWDEGNWQLSNVDASIYTYDGATGNYLSWNGITGSLTDGVIPVAQGFFVHANGPDPTIVIPAEARVTGNLPLYKNTDANTLRLDVACAGSHFRDAAFILFHPEAEPGFDARFDAYQLDGDPAAPQIYTLTGQTRLSINALPDLTPQLQIPISFVAGTNDIYSLSASGLTSLTTATAVHLRDELTGKRHDLLANPVYEFQSEPGLHENRFTLLFGTTGLNDSGSLPEVNAWYHNQMLIINGLEGQSGVFTLTDMAGKKWLSEKVSDKSSYSRAILLPAGVYLLKFAGNHGCAVRKILATRSNSQ